MMVALQTSVAEHGVTTMSSLVFSSANKPVLEDVTDVTNTGYIKPHGGLWLTSHEYTWKQWCYENRFSNPDGQTEWVIPLKNDPNFLVIDTLEDYIKIVRRWKMPDKYPDKPGLLPHALDFEKIGQVYDGIFLTERGQWRTRMPREPYEDYTLYGWDLESVLILGRSNAEHVLDFENITRSSS